MLKNVSILEKLIFFVFAVFIGIFFFITVLNSKVEASVPMYYCSQGSPQLATTNAQKICLSSSCNNSCMNNQAGWGYPSSGCPSQNEVRFGYANHQGVEISLLDSGMNPYLDEVGRLTARVSVSAGCITHGGCQFNTSNYSADYNDWDRNGFYDSTYYVRGPNGLYYTGANGVLTVGFSGQLQAGMYTMWTLSKNWPYAACNGITIYLKDRIPACTNTCPAASNPTVTPISPAAGGVVYNSQVTFSWSGTPGSCGGNSCNGTCSGATTQSYTLYITGSGGGTYSVGSATSYTVNLQYNQSYTWYVQTTNGCARTASSTARSFTTQQLACGTQGCTGTYGTQGNCSTGNVCSNVFGGSQCVKSECHNNPASCSDACTLAPLYMETALAPVYIEKSGTSGGDYIGIYTANEAAVNANTLIPSADSLNTRIGKLIDTTIKNYQYPSAAVNARYMSSSIFLTNSPASTKGSRITSSLPKLGQTTGFLEKTFAQYTKPHVNSKNASITYTNSFFGYYKDILAKDPNFVKVDITKNKLFPNLPANNDLRHADLFNVAVPSSQKAIILFENKSADTKFILQAEQHVAPQTGYTPDPNVVNLNTFDDWAAFRSSATNPTRFNQVPNQTLVCRGKNIFLIPGDLTISAEIINETSESSCVFIVEGTLTIKMPDRWTSPFSTNYGNQGRRVDGLFLANNLVVEGKNDQGPVIVQGQVITHHSNGSNTPNTHKVYTNDRKRPQELYIYDPRHIIIWANELGGTTTSRSIREERYLELIK